MVEIPLVKEHESFERLRAALDAAADPHLRRYNRNAQHDIRLATINPLTATFTAMVYPEPLPNPAGGIDPATWSLNVSGEALPGTMDLVHPREIPTSVLSAARQALDDACADERFRFLHGAPPRAELAIRYKWGPQVNTLMVVRAGPDGSQQKIATFSAPPVPRP